MFRRGILFPSAGIRNGPLLRLDRSCLDGAPVTQKGFARRQYNMKVRFTSEWVTRARFRAEKTTIVFSEQEQEGTYMT